jgi:hypothetical protein
VLPAGALSRAAAPMSAGTYFQSSWMPFQSVRGRKWQILTIP